MPKLKQLPRNAYETLCAELARATTTPFGAWCALGGREAVGYVTHADFAQAAERCERIGVTVFDELASYLRTRANEDGPRWLLTAGDADVEAKALRDPHAIGLLCLDYGRDHALTQLASHVGNLLTQYAILETEGRLLARMGASSSIASFPPIEKNRSFASTGAKIGQLMGYVGYSEKDAELPLAIPSAAVPSSPKEEGPSSPRYVQYRARQVLFRVVEAHLDIVRASVTLRDRTVTPVAWRWATARTSASALGSSAASTPSGLPPAASWHPGFQRRANGGTYPPPSRTKLGESSMLWQNSVTVTARRRQPASYSPSPMRSVVDGQSCTVARKTSSRPRTP